jgi:hypothetical protein
MTIEEFNNTRFGAGDSVIYKNELWPIVAVEFEEALFAITVAVADQMNWVRCENCQYISKDNLRVPS